MRVPIVFDNLIHKGEVPVTIGIFVNPGHRGDAFPENRWRANNRSYEYDSLGDEYARFLLEELLPAVSEKYNLSDDTPTAQSAAPAAAASAPLPWLGSGPMRLARCTA